METVQIQLPRQLLDRMQHESSSNEVLSDIISEAIQLWLAKRQEKKNSKHRVREVLQRAGLVMDPDKQRAMAQAMLKKLTSRSSTASHAEVRASLAKLKVPLSEEILSMRGDR